MTTQSYLASPGAQSVHAAPSHHATKERSASGHSEGPHKDKKWKQILKFGSIGRKPGSSQGAASYEDRGHSGTAPKLPSIPTSAGSSLGGSFKPMQGSTVVADPNSLSNDSYSSGSQDGAVNDGALDESANTSAQSNGYSQKSMRRISSAPDAKKLYANGSFRANGHSGEGKNGQASPHLDSVGPMVSSTPMAVREDGFFPGSPVRMDSNATSFSSKDFEKASKSSKSGIAKSKSGIIFPGSRNKNGAKSGKGDFKAGNQLAPPSSAGAMAAAVQTNGHTLTHASSRGSFRRTYSSNSIKVKDVEVGPSSFSKVKMLGKGDVGKVYLVREKKTEKLFAMKGE